MLPVWTDRGLPPYMTLSIFDRASSPTSDRDKSVSIESAAARDVATPWFMMLITCSAVIAAAV